MLEIDRITGLRLWDTNTVMFHALWKAVVENREGTAWGAPNLLWKTLVSSMEHPFRPSCGKYLTSQGKRRYEFHMDRELPERPTGEGLRRGGQRCTKRAYSSHGYQQAKQL
jgi:hypothetical protein